MGALLDAVPAGGADHTEHHRDLATAIEAVPAERAAASTTPAAIGTAAVGVGTTDARADHVHATGAGTPSTQAFGDAAATGTGPAAAMTDHKHAMPSSPLGLPLGLTGATGATRYVGATTAGTPTTGTFAVGDFVVDQSGRVWVCVTAGSPGTWRGISEDPNALASGQETIPRLLVGGVGSQCSSGILSLSYFTATRTETCTKIRTRTGSTGAGATPTRCRVGLYSVASNGDITLVASIPNTTSLWAGSYTSYNTNLSVSYQVQAGQRYALGLLIVTAAATPTFYGLALGNNPPDADLAPRVWAVVSGQTDLPASVANASIEVWAASSAFIWMGVLP